MAHKKTDTYGFIEIDRSKHVDCCKRSHIADDINWNLAKPASGKNRDSIEMIYEKIYNSGIHIDGARLKTRLLITLFLYHSAYLQGMSSLWTGKGANEKQFLSQNPYHVKLRKLKWITVRGKKWGKLTQRGLEVVNQIEVLKQLLQQ